MGDETADETACTNQAKGNSEYLFLVSGIGGLANVGDPEYEVSSNSGSQCSKTEEGGE